MTHKKILIFLGLLCHTFLANSQVTWLERGEGKSPILMDVDLFQDILKKRKKKFMIVGGATHYIQLWDKEIARIQSDITLRKSQFEIDAKTLYDLENELILDSIRVVNLLREQSRLRTLEDSLNQQLVFLQDSLNELRDSIDNLKETTDLVTHSTSRVNLEDVVNKIAVLDGYYSFASDSFSFSFESILMLGKGHAVNSSYMEYAAVEDETSTNELWIEGESSMDENGVIRSVNEIIQSDNLDIARILPKRLIDLNNPSEIIKFCTKTYIDSLMPKLYFHDDTYVTFRYPDTNKTASYLFRDHTNSIVFEANTGRDFAWHIEKFNEDYYLVFNVSQLSFGDKILPVRGEYESNLFLQTTGFSRNRRTGAYEEMNTVILMDDLHTGFGDKLKQELYIREKARERGEEWFTDILYLNETSYLKGGEIMFYRKSHWSNTGNRLIDPKKTYFLFKLTKL